LNLHGSKDLLFRALGILVPTSAKYGRDSRHLYCVVMLGLGRLGIALLHSDNHPLDLRGIALLHSDNHPLNLRGIALLHSDSCRINQPPQRRLNFA
jgi:hypothetical protein